jgi:hypothetical protein
VVVVVVDMDVEWLDDLCGGEECCCPERKGVADEDGGGEVGSMKCVSSCSGVRGVWLRRSTEQDWRERRPDEAAILDVELASLQRGLTLPTMILTYECNATNTKKSA